MTDALTKLKERINTAKDQSEYDLMIKDYANERLKELEDYAKNQANYQHPVVVSEPIGITLSKEEAEKFKAFIAGGQHD